MKIPFGLVLRDGRANFWLNFFFLKVSIYPKSDAKDPLKLLKFEKTQTLTLNISRTAGNI
jgi:hypothetical protein